MTDHPLTETVAEITDEMIEAGASHAWNEANPGNLDWDSLTESHKEGCRRDARAVLTAALPLLADAIPNSIGNENPWKPVDDETVRVGDEVRQDLFGVSTIAIVDRIDEGTYLWVAEGGYIGNLHEGDWYHRQPNLPDRDGVNIIPTDPAVGITTSDGRKFTRLTYNKDYSIWVGVDEHTSEVLSVKSRNINPGTWKIER